LGGAVVTVRGSNFKQSQDLRCNFGGKNVLAEYLTSNEVKCTVPAWKIAATQSGRKLSFWISGSAEISNNVEITYHSTLLVSDVDNNCVHAFDSHHGVFAGTLIPSGSGGLQAPQGIQIGNDNNIYVASGTNQVLKYNTMGQSLGVFAELPKGCAPSDIVFGPDTNLFVACRHLNKVIAFNAHSGQQLGVAAQGGGLSRPTGIAFGPGNTLYVVSSGSNKLLRFAQGGYFQGAVQKLVDEGKDVAFYDGKIFLSGGASHNNAILTVVEQKLHTFAESFQLREPVGIVFDGSSMFVASSQHIVRFNNNGGYISSMKAGRKTKMRPSFMTSSPRESRRAGGGRRHDEL